MDSSNSHRRFLKAAVIAVPGAALIGCHGESPYAELNAANAPGPLFLNDAEKHFLDTATERLIPGDAASPGANRGVTVFIDRQLSGPYGMAETWYMRGPWSKGSDEQGWQSKLKPAQMYRARSAISKKSYC
ncbi:MAG: hypothetical protein ABI132_01570 [Rhodanobacteraceae bacterium]